MENNLMNRAHESQLEIVRALKEHDIKYLAFGSFSIDSYDQSRLNPSIKLWISPDAGNQEKFNKLLPELPCKVLPGDEKSKMAYNAKTSPAGVHFYNQINGFKKKDFEDVYNRRNTIPAHNISNPDLKVELDHLSLKDLFHNVQHTSTKAQKDNLDVLYQASKVFKVENGLISEPKKQETNQINLPMKDNRENKSKISRDFDEIREKLDIELVLQNYGYRLSDKTGKNDQYRIYKPGDPESSQRIAVMNRRDLPFKGFVDLNNTTFKGDSISFIKEMEQGDWKRTFQVIDSIMGKPDFLQKKNELPPLSKAQPVSYLNDEKVVQNELFSQYKALFVTKPEMATYLTEKRSLDSSTILDPSFKGQLLQIKIPNKNDESRYFINTAFPLVSESGNIISLDIRGEKFKSFPDGTKGNGLWMSNPKVEFTNDVVLRNRDGESLSVKAGSQAYVSKIGINIDDQTYSFEGAQFKHIKPTSLIFIESPIDALSFHQLNPPEKWENRLYVSPSGNPSGQQLEHISKILGRNPDALKVLAFDGDSPGLRYAINLMGKDTKSAVQPEIYSYHQKTPDGNSKHGNQLTITHPEKLASLVRESFRNLANSHSLPINTDNPGKTILSIPNHSNILGQVLDTTVKLVNELSGNKFVSNRTTELQKDFNDVLQQRAGKKLPEDSSLKFKPKQNKTITKNQADKPQIKVDTPKPAITSNTPKRKL